MTPMEGHIGLLQGVILLYAILSASLFTQYPQMLVEIAGPAAWQAAIVMTLTGMALFVPTVLLVRRFPGQGLAEVSEEVAGPFLGPLLTLIAFAWLLGVTSNTVRLFTETFITTILPRTPPSVLTVVVMVCIIYASYRGIETLSRATQVFLPLIIAGSLLLLLFSLPRGDVSRLYPFWGYGINSTMIGGAFYSTMATESVILLIAGFAFRSPRTFARSGFYGIALFGITATAIVTVIIMVFGTDDAMRLPFPMFNIARLLYLGRFLQRTESVFVLFWFFSLTTRLSALFYALVITLSGALRLPQYRPLCFPMAVIVVSLSLLPKDLVSVIRLDRDWVRPFGFVLFALPLLLWIVALIRGKGGSTHEA